MNYFIEYQNEGWVDDSYMETSFGGMFDTLDGARDWAKARVDKYVRANLYEVQMNHPDTAVHIETVLHPDSEHKPHVVEPPVRFIRMFTTTRLTPYNTEAAAVLWGYLMNRVLKRNPDSRPVKFYAASSDGAFMLELVETTWDVSELDLVKKAFLRDQTIGTPVRKTSIGGEIGTQLVEPLNFENLSIEYA